MYRKKNSSNFLRSTKKQLQTDWTVKVSFMYLKKNSSNCRTYVLQQKTHLHKYRLVFKEKLIERIYQLQTDDDKSVIYLKKNSSNCQKHLLTYYIEAGR